MIKRLYYYIASILLVLGLFFSGNAFAASTVRFEGGAENFVFLKDGAATTDLFDELKNLVPGDTKSEVITVKNIATDYDYVKIYLRAEPNENSADFLSQLDIKIYQDSELLSNASASDSAGLTNDVLLGTFNPNEEITLTVELSAPLNLGNDYQHATGDITWIFTAEAYKDGQIITPNTGTMSFTPNATEITLFSISALGTLIIIISVIIKNHGTRP